MHNKYCPVRRMDKPGVSVSVTKERDNLLAINATIKVPDIITPTINKCIKQLKKMIPDKD